MLSSDDVFFGVYAPEGYRPADEAAIARILIDLKRAATGINGIESLEGAIALETLAQEIRAKAAKGG